MLLPRVFLIYLTTKTAVSHPSTQERLSLRTAKDYADRLSVHGNHLNKVLKESTENNYRTYGRQA